MNNSDWEAVIEMAADIESEAGGLDADLRRAHVSAALDKIVARFERRQADDLAARAIVALAEAWLQRLADFAHPSIVATRPRLIPHHLVVGQHLLDGRAGRERVQFARRTGEKLLAIGDTW